MKAKLLLILIIVALAGSLVAAACTSEEEAEEPTATPVATEAPLESIKIGAMLGLTGGMSTGEHQTLHGIELAFDEVNYEVAGREIELIVEDVGMDPAPCLEKVIKLNEMDNVALVIGPPLTHQGLAILNYIEENELITISHFCSSQQFVKESYSDYFFRSSHISGAQVTSVAGDIAYKVKGYRKGVAMAMDYATGHDQVEGFKTVFEGLGGEIVQTIYTPMGTLDYSSYMAQIDVDNAEFITGYYFGDDGIRWVKALEGYGIKDKLEVFALSGTVEPPDLWSQGDSAIGIEDVSHYSVTLDTPVNNGFVQAIWDNYQEDVTIYTEHGYTAARMAILAIEAVDGDVEDTDGMIEALENLDFEAPRGPLRFELHSPVQNVYHRIVEKVDGKLQNTVIGNYTDIEPLWLPEELQ
ncbi:MAG TPA: ABC transporter substrate-binding protein [Dehalococcoidia bacterium]|nr:ABC transporter substrate-binding protein [Dehalococcoidia bacterium]